MSKTKTRTVYDPIPVSSNQIKTTCLPINDNTYYSNRTPLGSNQSYRQPTYHGSWGRTKYDQGSLVMDTRQATSAVQYSLDPNYAERCSPCLPLCPGVIGKQGVSYDANKPMIDTESNLRNLDRSLTRDPNFKYLPYCPNCQECASGYPCGGGVVTGCQHCQPDLYHFPTCASLKYEYTRFTNPPSTTKEAGINRFQPLYLNPQDRNRWEHPGEIGINYRLIAKDNHIPCIPHPIDPTLALPKGGDLPCQITAPTCSAPIAALHQHYK